MTTNTEFTREIHMRPSYDHRDEPADQRGAHGVDIVFTLRGPLGAIVGEISTGWMSRPLVGRHTRGAGTQDRSSGPGVDRGVADLYPTGRVISLHAAEQRRDYWIQSPDCDVLGTGPCWNDGSYSIADGLLKALVAEGSDGAWRFLQELYYDWLPAEAVTP